VSATWFPELAEGETILDRVVNHRPAYANAMRDVESALWNQEVLEPEILELCRLRIAQLLGSDDEGGARTPAAAALDESLVERLPQWPTAPGFTDRQRTCLGFAEQVLLDAQGVTDEQAVRVIDAVGEGGFLVLAYDCGFFETTQRAQLLLAAGRET
jgi:alkylhydroperoxidase family enzyme